MATVLTDNAHYAAIASAIRGKNGLSSTYTPSQMASAIAAIPSGSSAVLVPKSITQNGVYDPADDSADGYSSVDVSVQGGGVPTGYTYYNGYLLPTIPAESGYDYVFVRKNDQNGNFEAIYGASPWYAGVSLGATLSNWYLTYTDIQSRAAKVASIAQTNPQQWSQPEATVFNSFGTDNGREVVWSSHDMLCGPNSSYDVLYKSGQAIDQTEADPNLGTKAITQNGTYSAEDDGLDGYSSVSVDVQGGGGSAAMTGIVERTLSTLYDSAASFVAASAFYWFGNSLRSVELPNVTVVRDYAFASCYSMNAVAMPSCTLIGSHAFEYCRALSEANFPMCSNVGSSAFYGCSTIAALSLPACEAIGSSAFNGCSMLQSADLPECRILGAFAFRNCSRLASVSLPKCSVIGQSAFHNCQSLMAIYVLASSVVTGVGSMTFNSTPMSASSYTGSFGSIYVPSSLYEAYVSATGWSYYASRIASYTEA